ncbi:MAG: PadR family transcriptional regulator [Cytophagaceae bacterium]|nr:PadR family transcriptional regulator [Gemmatimonadaceae bacterium]
MTNTEHPSLPPPDVLTELSLQVLLATGDGPLHGYAIGKDIEARTLGRLDPTTGALYQALKRLTVDGLLRPVSPPSRGDVDARRKHFAITPAGRKAVAAEIERLDTIVALARSRRLYPARA